MFAFPSMQSNVCYFSEDGVAVAATARKENKRNKRESFEKML